MRIKLASIMVDNQDKALKFYTEIFGFVKKHDIPVGGGLRWITLVSPEAVDDAELSLLLEPQSLELFMAKCISKLKLGYPCEQTPQNDVKRSLCHAPPCPVTPV
jgi:hypothetical protein